MSIPDYQSLMLPVLRLAAKGETRVADIAARIADEFGLSPEEREELLPSGRQRILHNRIHWAKFYMTKAGPIEAPARGRFVATIAGRNLLANNPKHIDVKLLLQREEFRDFYKASNNGDDVSVAKGRQAEADEQDTDTVTPEEQIEAAYQAVLSALRADLIDGLRRTARPSSSN